MKRAFRILALLLALLIALSMTAGAATVYDLTASRALFSDCKIVPYSASGKAASATASVTAADGSLLADASGNPQARMIFKDVEKLVVSFTPTAADEEYLVFLLDQSTSTVPTAENVYYLDQKTVSGLVEFTVYPSELAAGEYGIYISSVTTGYKEIGSIKVARDFAVLDFMLGDVDGSLSVNVTDVTEVLNYIVGNRTFNDNQKKAADVDGSGTINVTDATEMLNYIVRNLVSF